jgi:GlpG protein
MSGYCALSISVDENIGDLSRTLWSMKIEHRISEVAGKQVVYVVDRACVEQVQALYLQFQQGLLQPQQAPARQPRRRINWQGLLTVVPVTLMTILLSLVGTAIVSLDPSQGWMHWFTFQDYFYQGRQLYFMPAQDSWQTLEFWRLLTPTFLHFGLLHIVFNIVWMWFFGHRIELIQGRYQLLTVVLITALAANIAQFIMSPGTIFGGLSGVDSGLVGYVWVWSLLRRGEDFAVPQSLIYMMLVYLVVAASGIVTFFSGTSVANAAHFGGLFAGMFVAAISVFIGRRYRLQP